MTEPGPEFKRVGAWGQIREYRGALVIPEAPDGRILMQMRDDIEGIAAPGKWGFFGGGVDPGETPHDAVVREFHEETGLSRAPDEFTPAYAVLTGAPKWGLLYVYHLSFDTPAADIRVLEGGGFALATRRQIENLDLIPYLRDVLNDFWEKRGNL